MEPRLESGPGLASTASAAQAPIASSIAPTTLRSTSKYTPAARKPTQPGRLVRPQDRTRPRPLQRSSRGYRHRGRSDRRSYPGATIKLHQLSNRVRSPARAPSRRCRRTDSSLRALRRGTYQVDLLSRLRMASSRVLFEPRDRARWSPPYSRSGSVNRGVTVEAAGGPIWQDHGTARWSR